MKKLIICAFLFIPSLAFGWGSYELTASAPLNFNTHTVIDQIAYNKLSTNDIIVFVANKFPKLEDITFREGNDLLAGGVPRGPDSPGGSNFSDHYYNAYTKDGTGPWAVEREFIKMIEARLQSMPMQEARATAWTAHFMADMSVPYHVIGATIGTISKIWLNYGQNEPVPLSDDLLGRRDLLGAYPMDQNEYHRILIGRFLDLSTTDTSIDYFDPWYWNGDDITWFKTSSHIVWEGQVPHDTAYGNTGYSPSWHNADDITFDQPWKNQAAKARLFAIVSALNTRSKTSEWAKNRRAARDAAIQDVHTLWRASISGLRADYYMNPASGSENILRYELVGLPGNVTEEIAKNAQMRFVIEGGNLVSGEKEIQTIGDLKPNDALAGTPKWTFVVTNPAKCKIRLEIIGRFEKTPDLQYNFTDILFKTANDAVNGSMSFNLNFSFVRADDTGASPQQGTDFWGNGQAVSMPQEDTNKFGQLLELDGQRASMFFTIDTTGTRIQSLDLVNEMNPNLGVGNSYQGVMKLSYKQIPLRMAYPLGGNMWIYGFWIPRGGHIPFITNSSYAGQGRYDLTTYSDDGLTRTVKRVNYTVTLKEFLWDQSFIYLEAMNKTPDEIQAIIARGDVSQAEFNKGLENYSRLVNRAMGW